MTTKSDCIVNRPVKADCGHVEKGGSCAGLTDAEFEQLRGLGTIDVAPSPLPVADVADVELDAAGETPADGSEASENHGRRGRRGHGA